MKYSLLVLAYLAVTSAFAGEPASSPPWTTVNQAVSSWARSPVDKSALAGYIAGVSDEYVWEYKTDLKRLTGGKVLTGDKVLICPDPQPLSGVIEAWLTTPNVLAKYGSGSLLAAVDVYMARWVNSSCHVRRDGDAL